MYKSLIITVIILLPIMLIKLLWNALGFLKILQKIFGGMRKS